MLIPTMSIIFTVIVAVIAGVWHLSGRISSIKTDIEKVGIKLDTFIEAHRREHDVFILNIMKSKR